MILSNTLHKTLRRMGFDYCRYLPALHAQARRRKQLQTFGIDLVLDVGANRGQTGLELRSLGYTGEIVSFEPLTDVFNVLSQVAQQDGAWRAFNVALGSADMPSTINISANSVASSLLDTLPAKLIVAPDARYIDRQQIEVRTLDSLFDSLALQAHNIYLKIDTQGFELEVLAGAARSLPRIGTLQLEMALTPLYRDGPLFHQVIEYLAARDYELVSLEPVFVDGMTGRVLQMDGVFHRYSAEQNHNGN